MAKQMIQPVRGTRDYIGKDMQALRLVMDTARQIAAAWQFQEVQTPVFEFTEVFHRSLGDTSDVVSKETYTFEDRGGESITLRPEFTAAIVRAFVSGGYTQQLPFKAFYQGAAFRYERPQKGRLRQFHQVGVEALGATEAWQDADVIACGYAMLQQLFAGSSIAESIALEINTLGDAQSRQAYRDKLVQYFRQHEQSLSEESRVRLEKNPLRILDSKQEKDKVIVANAPLFEESLNEASKAWFATVTSTLQALSVPYQVSPRLVRGLDYYTHTVFEFTTDKLGSQATVLAGGRYDGLIEQMGGGAIPAIGWAAGVERLMLLLEQMEHRPQQQAVQLLFIVTQADYLTHTLEWVYECRAAGIPTDILQHKNIGKALKKADNQGASHVVVIGGSEITEGRFSLKQLASGESNQYGSIEKIIHILQYAIQK